MDNERGVIVRRFVVSPERFERHRVQQLCLDWLIARIGLAELQHGPQRELVLAHTIGGARHFQQQARVVGMNASKDALVKLDRLLVLTASH
jgi:hypothetical protein